MQLDRKYIRFYSEGRDYEDDFDEDEIDFDEVVDKAMRGPDDPRTVAQAVAVTIVTPSELGREKRAWLADNKDLIKDAGGDEELAFKHYLHGRIHQYAALLEDALCAAMSEEFAEEDDPDDDDDDDEGEDA